jgi:queuine tRNA-ribosyltransferase
MYEVVGWAISGIDDARPRHLLGIGDVDDLIRGVELGVDTFDCAMPTRLGRHGVALVPEPAARWRVDLTAARWKESREPIMDGCPCPSCEAGHPRGYLRYLLRNRELTAVRLLTVHNLAYLARLMADLRGSIAAGTLAERAAALRAGAAPRAG